jgi:hypothetical protein
MTEDFMDGDMLPGVGYQVSTAAECESPRHGDDQHHQDGELLQAIRDPLTRFRGAWNSLSKVLFPIYRNPAHAADHPQPEPPAPEPDHAYQNARASMASILGMVARLDHANNNHTMNGCGDYDESGPDAEFPCEVEHADIIEAVGDWEKAGTPPSPEQWDEYHDAEKAEEHIHQDALSVEVRDNSWATPGQAEYSPTQFNILLTTGGPALRIMGQLDEWQEPRRAWLEYQDWGTPWTEYHGDNASQDALLTYARCFYFAA